MSYNFWFNNPRILIDKNYLSDFFPNDDITNVDNLNAIVRLSIYVSILLFLFRFNFNVFIIPVIVGLVTLFLFKYNTLDEKLSILTNLEDVNTDEEECMRPTEQNIFMNTNLTQIGTDEEVDKKKACKLTPKVMEEQDKLFNDGVFHDINDIFKRRNSQMRYHTMPETSKEFGFVGDTSKFRKWAYGQGPTCKEDTNFCTGKNAMFISDRRRNRSTVIKDSDN
jgi:hypothetical protein